MEKNLSSDNELPELFSRLTKDQKKSVLLFCRRLLEVGGKPSTDTSDDGRAAP
ncbi:MAG: hypothetical protein AAGI03_01970 [Pseudomonadota bacterium]